MAILQKLETSYSAILRFVVLLISGLLLTATFIVRVERNLRPPAHLAGKTRASE
ncbi:MAG: hypothetical protein Q8O64_16745 [Sideroxyarcus sp.]|nr:hypothetical protein [Sideroxyarcus sp.]